MKYTPHQNHPWRRYKDKAEAPTKKEEKRIKSLHVFIAELAESWETIEIYTTYKGEGKYFLVDLPQSKQAAWLVGLLKRNYQAL